VRRVADAKLAQLLELIDALPPDLEFALGARDRNARDVLGHIAAWHQMLLRWTECALRGEDTPVPAPGHTWDDVVELNQAIWRVSQDLDHARARSGLERSHRRVMDAMRELSDAQLWGPGLFGWARDAAAGAWFERLTWAHYEWGAAKTRRALRVASLDVNVDDDGPRLPVSAAPSLSSRWGV
jgi:hypothetical protein